MSVPVWKRKKNLLSVEVKAIELLHYMIVTATSEKNFPVRYKHELSLPVIMMARQILHLTTLANKTPANNEELIQQRREYFFEALKIAQILKIEIVMNMNFFKLIERKADYIDTLIESWKSACYDWLQADYKKYGKEDEKKVCD